MGYGEGKGIRERNKGRGKGKGRSLVVVYRAHWIRLHLAAQKREEKN